MSEFKRYFIKLGYDGTNYHGWQRQPDAVTVQQSIEDALTVMLRREVLITGAGRTDAGVHARLMVAHVDLKPDETIELVHKLNRYLKSNIAIYSIVEVAGDAHARFGAVSRSYEYHLHKRPDPFQHNRSLILRSTLDLKAMQEAAQLLFNYKDFKCFSRTHTDVSNYLCTIMQAQLVATDYHIVFHITANRFLRNMVRAIVGTLLEIGYGKKPISYMREVIESQDRAAAGASAPAHGLYLTDIKY